MRYSVMQLKAKVRNIAAGDSNKANSLYRIFFMERFLERVSLSRYKNNFILKGGMLVSALLGVETRTTMDIDTTVQSLSVEPPNISKIVGEICEMSLDDGVYLFLSSSEIIMSDFTYPGVRIHISAVLDNIRSVIKFDISTDDVITPEAVDFSYKLLFEDRYILLLTYNTETLMAEKMQSIIERGLANTRLRDFYDLYSISKDVSFDIDVLKSAFNATCVKRNTVFSQEKILKELHLISDDEEMKNRWMLFRNKNYFVGAVQWEIAVSAIAEIFNKIL